MHPEIKPVSRPSYYPHMSAETHDIMNSLYRQKYMTLCVKRSNAHCLHTSAIYTDLLLLLSVVWQVIGRVPRVGPCREIWRRTREGAVLGHAGIYHARLGRGHAGRYGARLGWCPRNPNTLISRPTHTHPTYFPVTTLSCYAGHNSYRLWLNMCAHPLHT